MCGGYKPEICSLYIFIEVKVQAFNFQPESMQAILLSEMYLYP